ncbi:MAG: hypothetical protein PHO84_09200 [Dysgonamonadaceae bacterium]|nr:hypothetical protein [Dysgonamonadaceae bacterium]
MSKIPENIEWSIRVPMFRNSIIMKQLGIAIGIPFVLLIIFLIIVKATYALIIIGTLFLFTYLFILIVWGGKYDVGFKLNKAGIHNFTLKNQAKKNLITNTATVILGLFSGKPAVSGAGMLAQSKQNVLIKWSSISKVKFIPKKHTIMIRAGFTENIALFCTPENYTTVESLIRTKLKEKDIILSKKDPNTPS